MSRVSTIAYGSVKEYATVPARLKEFRETNPRASIKSVPKHHEDGSLEFETIIIVDKSDEYSADANGHAFYTSVEAKQKKAYEKLETISIGRCLAKLGYLNNGEVATTEEMDEFESFKQDRSTEAVNTINNCKTIDELKTYFLSIGTLASNPTVYAAKEAKKKELSA